MSADRGFQNFAHGHQDLVLAIDFNFYGNRLVTASSDHRLKVWHKKDDLWELVDSWRAHDAEITDVKWNGPFVGQTLGSIGEDGYFKLWEEDVSQAHASGRRFKSIMSLLASRSKLPWMTLDFKNIGMETYLALITRDGHLSIMEPKDHDLLAGDWTDWMENQDFPVCPAPSRSVESGFRVCFHQEKMPCWTAVSAGLDRRALSLAVAAMNTVKVYRTDKDRRLYLAAELVGGNDIVRDVAWANGSMRGFDVIATASRDGTCRVYELRTSNEGNDESNSGAVNSNSAEKAKGTTHPTNQNGPSGIGASLAGVVRSHGRLHEGTSGPGRVKQYAVLVAELISRQVPAWRVAFSYTGDVLISTGDDGKIRTWKRAINNKWLEYAEIDVKNQN